MTIYSSILNFHFTLSEHKFVTGLTQTANSVVTASILLHNKVSANFLPTASKFHYVFNLRDLTNIFQVYRTRSGRF
jgi:dynein heavy chain